MARADNVVYAKGTRAPKGIPAKLVHDELVKLRRQGQGIDPEDVVDAAKDPSHPLHDAFEWDDTEAARQYRLEQARYLIRAVRIVVEEAEPIEYRAFINLEDDAGYRTAAEVGSDEDLRLRAIQLAQRDVDSAQARLRQFEGLGDVRQLLRQVQDALTERVSGGSSRNGHGRHGWGRFGTASLGRVWQAWKGGARQGQARIGLGWQRKAGEVLKPAALHDDGSSSGLEGPSFALFAA